MEHCAHIVAPSSAWSTEPKLDHSLSTRGISRLGDAIRALKPRTKKATTEEDSHLVNELGEHGRQKRPLSDETLSTAASDECSVASDESFSASDEYERPQNTEEQIVNFSLPGSVETIPVPSSTCSASADSDDEDKCDLEVASIACNHDLNQPTSLDHDCRNHRALYRQTELRQMALLISRRAASKYSGRVYQDVRNAFLAVDADADGKISPTEADAFGKHFNLSPEITKHFFSLLDPHQTGTANWSSFLAKFAPVFLEKTDWRHNPKSNLKLLNGQWQRQPRPSVYGPEQTNPAQSASPKSPRTPE